MTSSFGKKFEDSSPLVGLLLVKVNEAFIGLQKLDLNCRAPFTKERRIYSIMVEKIAQKEQKMKKASA
jgi:hypothetical protein